MPSPAKKLTDEASVVLLGDFNPVIFHPEWYLRHGLIEEEEGREAKVEVVMNDVAIVRLKWAVVEVMRERYTARSNDESHFDPLRDLVIGTFNLLEHTPIKQIGINRHIRFEVENADVWHHIGHVLAPKKHWRTHLREPGLMQITIRGKCGEPEDHQVNVTLKPISHEPPTIQLEINNHYILGQTKFDNANALLQARWEIDLSSSAKLAEDLTNAAIGETI